MATKITKIQVRRDTKVNWAAQNPVLSNGEIGFETDTYKFKIGSDAAKIDVNGESRWNNLNYFTGEGIDAIALKNVLSAGNHAPDEVMVTKGIGVVPVAGAGSSYSGGVLTDLVPAQAGTQYTLSESDVETPVNWVVPTDVNLGTPENPFGSLYLKNNSLHIGDSVISYLDAPTVKAELRVTAVDQFGRVTGVEILPDNTTATPQHGQGYIISTNLPTGYTAGSPGFRQGEGLTINVNSLTPGDGIGSDVSVNQAGVNYEVNDTLFVELAGQIVATTIAPDGSERVSPVATQAALAQTTTESVQLAASNLTTFLSRDNTRNLPEFSGSDQDDFNAWTVTSLLHLDETKISGLDCTVGGDLPPTPEGPDGTYTLLVINYQDGVVADYWGTSVAGATVTGGEILYYNEASGSWEFAQTAAGQEQDPVFRGHTAYRIVGEELTPGPGGLATVTFPAIRMGPMIDDPNNPGMEIPTGPDTRILTENWFNIPELT